jgi:hypothetical protein
VKGVFFRRREKHAPFGTFFGTKKKKFIFIHARGNFSSEGGKKRKRSKSILFLKIRTGKKANSCEPKKGRSPFRRERPHRLIICKHIHKKKATIFRVFRNPSLFKNRKKAPDFLFLSTSGTWRKIFLFLFAYTNFFFNCLLWLFVMIHLFA